MENVNWPRTWIGTWVAEDRKTVTISLDAHQVAVTVRPGPREPPYVSAELLGGGVKAIENLVARCRLDRDGDRILEIEAGTFGIGPTYRLYPVVEETGEMTPARDDARVHQLVLIPGTGIGLYDDWEDDIGVPWAYPLQPLRWADSVARLERGGSA